MAVKPPRPSSSSSSFPFLSSLPNPFTSTPSLLLASLLLRLILLLYGLHQDAVSAVKYTDIDYLVFTDAARSVSHRSSPYDRETYRYTPLLAWLLYPTSWSAARSENGAQEAATAVATSTLCFSLGKIIFALADVLAGWLLLRILGRGRLPGSGGKRLDDDVKARKFAAIWLLNPMVATISTRGSSEGLLGALVSALMWAVLERRIILAGVLLGFAVHFKIYPFIYAPAIAWWMDDERMQKLPPPAAATVKLPQKEMDLVSLAKGFFTRERVTLAAVSISVFMLLNAAMYAIYGDPFIQQTYLYHLSRIDHRHNFSPYNILLYLVSAASAAPSSSSFSGPHTGIAVESIAFVPQILLSTVLIPLACAKNDLPTTMLAQTFAFVTFNKVCTSQYFLWYLIFFPLYLPHSSLLRQPQKGLIALSLWIAAQAAWLHQGYQLEFLGQSTFVPGMWAASLFFFLANCWILGVVVEDVAAPAAAWGNGGTKKLD